MATWHASTQLVALALITGLSPQQTAKPAPIPPSRIHEELIFEAPRGSDITALSMMTGAERHVASVEKSNDRYIVRLDGKQAGAVYDEVRYLAFRGDDQRLSFVAKRDDRWMLVVDGREHGGDFTKMTAPDVDSEGGFATGVCHGKTCRLLVDNRETGPVFEDISAPDFSPNGLHSVYFGKRDKKWLAVVDGKETPPAMDDWWSYRWWPDGKRLAVAARLDDRFTWIVDGQAGPLFDVISAIAFSRDGQHYAYGGSSMTTAFKEREVRGAIVVDGKPLDQTYAGRGMPGGWRAMLGQMHSIVKGLRSLTVDFHGVSDPEFTAGGELAFGLRLGEGQVVVRVGDRNGPAFDDLASAVVVSPDGEHVIYVAKQGESFVEVRDQKPGPSFSAKARAAILEKRDIAFVPWLAVTKSGRVAYEIVRGAGTSSEGRVERGPRRAVIDGVDGPEYDALGINCRLSDTDQRHACVVHGAEGKRDRLVVTGRESQLYDDIVSSSIRLLPAGAVTFVARQERRVLGVTIDAE